MAYTVEDYLLLKPSKSFKETSVYVGPTIICNACESTRVWDLLLTAFSHESGAKRRVGDGSSGQAGLMKIAKYSDKLVYSAAVPAALFRAGKMSALRKFVTLLCNPH